jgi:peptidoglycan/xylan/chitin deacetylase (PgdA/CDA1 family)
MAVLKARVADGAHWLAWRSGLLRTQHHRRHSETLTVFGLHRVLRRDDPRWATAMPEWTVLDSTFRSALEFIAREYQVVSLSTVVKALQGGSPLPQRAALITFDDGWADTADTATPILREMGLPAVVFVISGLVGSARGTWESEWYAALQHAPDGAVDAVRQRYLPTPAVDLRSEGGVDALCRVLRGRPVEQRFELVGEHFGGFVECGHRQMVNVDDLGTMIAQGIEIGAHTVSHDPLVGLPTAREEITRSIEALAAMAAPFGATVQSFSFPHGSYDREIATVANDAGAVACFTSDLGLVASPSGRPGDFLMSRVWVGRSLAERSGRIVPHRAAWRYFRTDVVSARGPHDGRRQ